MASWLRNLYDRADALDADAFAGAFADDAPFTLGNFPPMRGPAEIAAGLRQFFATIDGMQHDFVATYQIGDTEIFEAVVTYTRKNGTKVAVPAMAVIERDGDKVRAGRAYIDLAPLFT